MAFQRSGDRPRDRKLGLGVPGPEKRFRDPGPEIGVRGPGPGKSKDSVSNKVPRRLDVKPRRGHPKGGGLSWI